VEREGERVMFEWLMRSEHF